MQITKIQTQYHKYAFSFDFSYVVVDFCRSLKNRFGWKEFSFSDDKMWHFSSLEVFDTILNKYPDVAISRDATEEIARDKELAKLATDGESKNLELKEKKKSTIQIVGIKGELREFQKVTVEFFVNNGGRGIMGLDVGLGKSLCALEYGLYAQKKKILIVCPASVKWSWHREVEKWTNLKAIVIHSQIELTPTDFNENDIMIVNYDILKKFLDFFLAFRFDCLILDESQSVKNIRTKRFKNIKQIVKNIDSVLLLSGTPMVNRPIELFTSLNIIDPRKWNNYWQYALTYCGAYKTRWGWDLSGASKIDELKQKIAPYYIRFKKEDVLKELPPKQFIDVPVELSEEYQLHYGMALDDLIAYLSEIRNKNDVEIERSRRAEELVRLNVLRQVSSLGKIEYTKEFVNNLIDSGEKVLVFTMFVETFEELKKYFGDLAVAISGSVSIPDRENAIEQFQNNEKVKVFIGTIKSCGVGITLTKASSVVFVDLPWTPGDFVQAYGRADRIGNQSDMIKIYKILANGTIDDKMSKLIESKQKLFDKIFDNKDDGIKIKQTSVANDLIKFIEKEKFVHYR